MCSSCTSLTGSVTNSVPVTVRFSPQFAQCGPSVSVGPLSVTESWVADVTKNLGNPRLLFSVQTSTFREPDPGYFLRDFGHLWTPCGIQHKKLEQANTSVRTHSGHSGASGEAGSPVEHSVTGMGPCPAPRDRQLGAEGQHYWKPGQQGLRGHQDTSLCPSVNKGAVTMPTRHPVTPSQKELEESRGEKK